MTTGSTDDALMIAVREGARAELGVLFERHHRAVYEFFYRMTGARPVSEDLVQEVFDRILKFRDTFRNESHFSAWLYRIARNVQHDYSRNRAMALPGLPSAPGDMAETLRRALLSLPEDRKELIVLSQYQQLTAAEIGELLDIETPEARVRVQRALIELRELYRKNCSGKRHAN